MKREPSKYQKEILDWVENGSGSGLVNALAGTGKTTTLEMVAKAVPSKMLFLAFNKHIADELSERKELKPLLDSKKLKVMTVNALGNMTLIDYCRNQLNTEPVLKSSKLVSDILDGVILDRLRKENKELPHGAMESKLAMDTIKKHAKTCCDLVRCHCIDHNNHKAIDKLIDDEHLFIFRKEILQITSIPRLDWSYIVSEAIEESIDFFEKTGEYDFLEQIYLPVKLQLYPPAWLKWYTDFIGVDESQDISTLQQRFIKKLQYMNPYKQTRYLFVGDEHQAIYKFNGADCNSINHIRDQFNTQELHLNICYRCSKKALILARKHAPLIEDAPNAKEGTINVIHNIDVPQYADNGDLVMARKNKDLVTIYLLLVKEKKKVYFKKGDFLFRIVKEIDERKRVKTIQDIENFIVKAKAKEINNKVQKDSKEAKNVIDMEEEDIYDIMFSLLNFFKNNYKELGFSGNAFGFTNFVRDIAKSEPSDDCVILGSIHAMKGLEAKNVFIINYFEMPYEFGMGGEYSIQEKNLKYIAETRTKENLYLCYDDEDEAKDWVYEFSSIVDKCQFLDKEMEEDSDNEDCY